MTADKKRNWQVSNMPDCLRRGVKMAAAMEDVLISEWVIKILRREVAKAGIVIEEDD